MTENALETETSDTPSTSDEAVSDDQTSAEASQAAESDGDAIAPIEESAAADADEKPYDANAYADVLLSQTAHAQMCAAVEAEAPPPAPSVMEQIADAAVSRYERLPMLEVILDRVVRQFTERLMQLSSTNADVSLHEVQSGRFGDMTAQIALPCLVAVVSAPDWSGECLVALDQRMIYELVEILLGGERDAQGAAPQVRQPTAIERRLTQRVFETFAETLQTAFSTLRPARFTVDRVETNPQFAMIARDSAATIGARIGMDVAGARGDLHVIIPYNTLEPVRPQLRQMFMGEKLGRDEAWDARMRTQVAGAPMRLSAQIDAGRHGLQSVLGWRPGDVIPLPHAGPRPVASIMCKGRALGTGPVGAENGRIAVRLDEAPLFNAAAKEPGEAPA